MGDPRAVVGFETQHRRVGGDHGAAESERKKKPHRKRLKRRTGSRKCQPVLVDESLVLFGWVLSVLLEPAYA